MAQARKAAAKRGTRKRSPARKTAKRSPARKAAKTAKRSPARKAAKTSRAAKATRAAKRVPARKTARKTVRKSARKGTRKTARKAVRKAVQAPRPSNPVSWFEIPVRDMARAQAFYEHVLQIKISLQDLGHFKMGWFPGAPDGTGAPGTLMLAESYVPSHLGSLVYFEVPDIEACLARAQQRGGKVLNPKMPIGPFGFVGHFEDSEGNRVALHSMQ